MQHAVFVDDDSQLVRLEDHCCAPKGINEPDERNTGLQEHRDLQKGIGEPVSWRHYFNDEIRCQARKVLLIDCQRFAMVRNEADVRSNQGVLIREDNEAPIRSDHLVKLVCVRVLV